MSITMYFLLIVGFLIGPSDMSNLTSVNAMAGWFKAPLSYKLIEPSNQTTQGPTSEAILVRAKKVERGATPFSGGPNLAAVGTSILSFCEDLSGSQAKMYVGTRKGLFMSDDGQTWKEVAIAGKKSEDVFTVSVNPTDEGTMFAGTREGLWKTQDGGQSWQKSQGALPDDYVPLSIAFSGSLSPSVAYMGTARHGVFKSVDGGSYWVPVTGELPEALAGGRPTPVKSLLVDPSNAEVVYLGTEMSSILKTTDGGKSWNASDSGLPKLISRRTSPPRLATDQDGKILYAVISQPLHSQLIRTSLYQSKDGGTTWNIMEVQLPPNLSVISLHVDSVHSSLIINSDQGNFTVSLINS